MHKLLAWSFGAALALTSSVAVGQVKWDMPTPYPDSTFHTENIRWFAEEVKKGSGNQLEIIVHSNNSLIKHPEILRAVQTGQVNIGEILISQFGNEDPLFELDGIPFFATGFEESWKLYQVSKRYLEDRYAKRGVRLLFSVAWSGQGLYSKTPLKSLSDFKGVKFRTYSPPTARMAELMGAVPTTVQASELPQAFATNIVTAMITSSITGASAKAWEFSNYYYDTKANVPRNAVIVNERAFRRLPEPVQQALLETSTRAETRGWELAKEAEAKTTAALVQGGMQVIAPDANMMAEFRTIGDTMIQEWARRAGPDGQNVVDAFRAR